MSDPPPMLPRDEPSETPPPGNPNPPAAFLGDPRYRSNPSVHIPGAGGIGMFILIVSLSMLFMASMVAMIAIRVESEQWPPAGAPHVPNSLWISTCVILMSSVTAQMAIFSVRKDDERSLCQYLLATLVIGVVFLGLQTFNWIEFYRAIERVTVVEGAYKAMFFVLTGLHAAHVIGGLIPLGIVLRNARGGRYSRNFHPGVRYVAVYWHFLDVIWVVLFLLIWF